MMSDSETVLKVYAILVSIFAIFILIRFIIKKIKAKKEKNVLICTKPEKDTLSFHLQYISYGSYSPENKIKSVILKDTLLSFRKKIFNPKIENTSDFVIIESKFNNIHYAFFDLDTIEHYNLFKQLYADEPYVIFHSSENKYWGILDKPYKSLDEVFNNINWMLCNDKQYRKFSIQNKVQFIRGMYDTKKRKPVISEVNKTLSENFENFINKLTSFYNKEGFELSVLRYEDHNMLLQFNRKLKLEKLKELNES